ncbi:MAG: Tad domain-containing protein [Henriciella sp.]|uniref:Tad domain-containing protein n=1 Tax=Henriciella sp. TaxID=1968823 RepID=UPI0032EB5381
MPVFAISLMSIMAMVGATIALGMDTRSGHQLQLAADASALGGATVFLNHASPKADERLKAAKEEASTLATNNSNYELRDLDVAAVTEDAYGQHTRLSVELEFKPVNYFSKFAGKSATTPMRRRSVAVATWGFPLCILTLEERNAGMRIKDQGMLDATNCIVWTNSDSSQAMRFSGGSATARAFCAVGEVDQDIRAGVEPEPESGCQPLPDPLEGYDLPVSGLCDSVSVDIVRIGSTRLTPGLYCGGLTIRARNVTLEPGVYIFRGGGLKIDARGSLTAEGVTFIFDDRTGQIDIKSGSELKITAPAQGETAGIAFAQINLSKNWKRQMRIRGKIDVEGVIYMPSYDIKVTQGGGGRTKSPYLQIVSNTLEVSNQGRLAIDFDMTETDLPLVIKPRREARLVE